MSPTASYGVLGWFQSLLRVFAIAVALLSWIQFIVDGERSKSELRYLYIILIGSFEGCIVFGFAGVFPLFCESNNF